MEFVTLQMRIDIKNSSNTIQATWLGIGSLVSLGFGIISAAILSRFLSKTDYGTYKQVLYVYNTLLIVFTLGLPRAYSYFLARVNKEEGFSLVQKINSMFFVLGAIFSIVLFFGSSLFADLLNNPELKLCLQYFSLTPIFMLPLMGIESVMATYKQTYLSTIYIISTRVFMLLCVVLPVLFIQANARTAVIGFVISSILCCCIGLFIERIPFKRCNKAVTSIGFKEILRFSLPLLVASFWGLIISSTNQFFISRYFGTEVFAEFANGYMELPFAGMIISATAAVLLPVFSKMAYNTDNDEILRLWKSVIIKSAKIIFPLSIFCCVFAKLIMQCLYGESYSNSSIYFQIITVVNLIHIVPYAPIMLALGKVKEYANTHMITALMIITLEYICIVCFPSSIGIAVISTFCTSFCIYLQMRVICKTLRISIWALVPFKELFSIILLSAISSLIAGFMLFILSEIEHFLALIFLTIISCCIYGILCKIFKISYWDIVKPYCDILNK